MEVFKRIIIVILIFLVIIYLGLCIFIWTKGKNLLSEKLSQLIGKEVNIGSLYISPPYTISIIDLKIEELLTIDKIKLEPSIIGLFLGQHGLNKLLLFRPTVSLVRSENAKFNINEIIDSIKLRRSKSKKKSKVIFFIKEAILKDGKITFQDKRAKLTFDILPLQMSTITSLRNFKTRINLEARAISDNGQNLGKISAAGWLNFFKKDMDVKLSLNDTEVAYFAAYFKKFFRKVKSGKLFFTADMVSRDNDLTIDCHLKTHDLRFSDESLIVDAQDKKITLFGNISGLVLDTLIGSGGGGIFDFSIHTKFDRPRLEGLQFKGNIFKEPIKNIFKRGPEQGVEVIKRIGKDFEALGKELKEQFKDIGDAFKGLKPQEIEEETEADNADSESQDTDTVDTGLEVQQ